jgi:hypothetical protein
MRLEFSGEIWFWKGPAPWYFVTIPEAECADLRRLSPAVSYGWGVIPVTVEIGRTRYTTSLFPKDGRYLVPIKAAVRKAEELDQGDEVRLRVVVAV